MISSKLLIVSSLLFFAFEVNKLPGWAQGALGITGFAKLLDFVDHFTETVEEAVDEGCKMLGMNDTIASTVTKVLLFLAL